MIILGCDPAKNTFAVSVIECDAARIDIIDHHMLINPVKELTGLVQDKFKRFGTEIRSLVKTYDVDAIAAERYMNRGRTGTAIELVSGMLGCIASSVKVDDVMLIPASQWKNAYNKLWDLDEIYSEAGNKLVHRLDATLIASYCSSHYFGIPPYSNLDPKKLIRSFQKCLKD